MLLSDALPLLERIIDTGETNANYTWVTKLADKYQKLVTGVDIGSLLIQFVQREDIALFEQRLKLTKSITPAVAASLRKPFNKIVRNERVRKGVELTTEQRTANVYAMIKGFFGAARKQNRGLDYWMKTRFLELQFTDPNAWLVVEWTQPENPAEIARPYPFEVSSKDATNWEIINDEIKWLQVTQAIKFLSIDKVEPNVKPVKKDGKKFTLYDEDITLVFEQCDRKYLDWSGYELQANEAFKEIKNNLYLVRIFYPKIGFVPAFRIGYMRDESTKGQTFVNPWHDALCYFEKSLKTVSEMDLTMALHVFPQKIQYVSKCSGMERNGRNVSCRNGKSPDGGQCGNCLGSGYKVHTTAADVINVPMPEDAKEMFNLDQMLVYKAPPIDTVKFQNEYILQLEKQTHQAVYNSQVFVKSQYSSGAGGTEAPTATETDYNMESVYDTLEPFTEKWSELWMDIVATFGVIAGEKLENIQMVHKFPADPKLKTAAILMTERERALKAGAPSFVVSTIDDDLADITFDGDELKINKYYVKRRYFPFPGKSADEITLLLASQFVPKYFKVLYSNFDQIFKDLEDTNPEIWADVTDTVKLDKLVAGKVDEYTKKLDGGATFDLNAFRVASPAGQSSEAA